TVEGWNDDREDHFGDARFSNAVIMKRSFLSSLTVVSSECRPIKAFIQQPRTRYRAHHESSTVFDGRVVSITRNPPGLTAETNFSRTTENVRGREKYSSTPATSTRSNWPLRGSCRKSNGANST